MHDLLYKNQTRVVADTSSSVVKDFFDGYASSLGLNVAKFNTDILGAQVATKIQNDVNGGNAAQINHTPTFFGTLPRSRIRRAMPISSRRSTEAVAAAGTAGSSTNP